MIGYFKKRLFRQMSGQVDTIKLSVCEKLLYEIEKQLNLDREEARLLTAAVVNRVFGGAVSPLHAEISVTLIDDLAADFLQKEKDQELLRGIIMSLRTMMTIQTDAHNTEAMNRIADTIQWIKSIIPLPPEEPNPHLMEHLAAVLQSRYLKQ